MFPVSENRMPNSGPDSRQRWMRQFGLFLILVATPFLLSQLVLALNVHTLEYDEAIYLDVARNIRRTGLPLRSLGLQGYLYAEHTSLYLYMLSGLTWLIGQEITALRWFTALIAGLTLWILFLVGRAMRGPVAGLVAATVLALNPFFALYSYFIREEIFVLLMLVSTLGLIVLAEQTGRIRYLISAAVTLTLAVLFKELALLFLPPLSLYLFISGTSWRRRLAAVWLPLPALLGVTAWLGYVWWLSPPRLVDTLGRWFVSLAGPAGAGPRTDLPAVTWLRLILGELIGWSALLLLLLAIWLAWQQRRRPPRVSLLLTLYGVGAVAISFLFTLKEPRHLMGVLPALALLVGILPDWSLVWSWAQGRRLRQGTLLLAAGVILFGLSPLELPGPGLWRHGNAWWQAQFGHRAFANDDYYEVLAQTGRYLAEHTAAGELVTVVHEGPVVGYYADRPHLFLYGMTLAEAEYWLGESNVLVVDQFFFTRLTPAEQTVIEASIAAQFDLEARIQDRGRTVSVYRRRVE